MNDNVEKIKQLYVMAEMTYMDNNNKSEKEIFPIDWYSSNNYIKKIEILGEAIKNNTLIVETNKYKEFSKILKK